jgi:hypothetical protein|tara:strand:+ start:4510 stop:5028 length:519 start_codon:yes stop_codon:yes gene_type:complete
MRKNLIKLVIVGSLFGLTALSSNHAKALEVKREGGISISGGGSVSLVDSFWIDRNFQGRYESFSLDGDGTIDVYSWQYTSDENGNAVVMINNRGMTSKDAFRKGISEEDYFEGFSKFVCRWKDPQSSEYGICKEIISEDRIKRERKNIKDLSHMQNEFSEETAEYFSSLNSQ